MPEYRAYRTRYEEQESPDERTTDGGDTPDVPLGFRFLRFAVMGALIVFVGSSVLVHTFPASRPWFSLIGLDLTKAPTADDRTESGVRRYRGFVRRNDRLRRNRWYERTASQVDYGNRERAFINGWPYRSRLELQCDRDVTKWMSVRPWKSVGNAQESAYEVVLAIRHGQQQPTGRFSTR